MDSPPPSRSSSPPSPHWDIVQGALGTPITGSPFPSPPGSPPRSP
jgi:hypothetical protein